ncbi:MAG: hypothetical protein ACOX2K_00865 [Bacillota bacterium]|jgi:putative transport protein
MSIVLNPLFLLFAAVFTGMLLGKVSVGRFRLGVSGTLFTGMAIGWCVFERYVAPWAAQYEQSVNLSEIPEVALRVLKTGLVDRSYFSLFLVLFVASVGLLAARDVAKVFRHYGLRFIVLGVIITLVGAASTHFFARLFPGQDAYAVTGVYTGALTSSPGLGASLEAVARLFVDPLSQSAQAAQASVGVGYAISYPFGVVAVIVAMHLFPRLFGIDVQAEQAALRQELHADKPADADDGEAGFDLAAFAFTCIVGYLLGQIAIPFGSLGKISLESTGGVLIAALFLGSFRRIGPLNFRMGDNVLGAIRQIALALFLAYVGLSYGHRAVAAISGPAVYLVLVGMACATLSLLVGFLVGRYALKINWVLLAGAICGGMTSTPGLGAAIDSTGSNEAAAGYGATYPMALFCMVLFSILLYRLPL